MASHDKNRAQFLAVAEEIGLTINFEKSREMSNQIKTLGYLIKNGELRPDPSRLQGLMRLKIPENLKELGRLKGLFVYYARWVRKFSERIVKLSNPSFPLKSELVNVIEELPKDVANSVRASIRENVPLTLETDASDCAIGAILSQEGRPVAFFSRSLNGSERNLSSVEKEALCCD